MKLREPRKDPQDPLLITPPVPPPLSATVDQPRSPRPEWVASNRADILGTFQEGYCLVNPAGLIAEANPAMAELLGCDLTELVGRPYAATIRRLLSPDPVTFPHPWPALDRRVRVVPGKGGRCFRVSTRMTADDDTWYLVACWLEVPEPEALPATADAGAGRAGGPVGAAEDRRAAEDARRVIRILTNDQHDGIFVKDAAGRYLLVTGQAAKQFGSPAGDCIGKRTADLLPPDTAARFDEEERAALRTGEPRRVLFKWSPGTLGSPRGAAAAVQATLTPCHDEAGRPLGVSGVIREVSADPTQDERRPGRSAPDPLARLAGGIAHGFNNLMTVTIGNAELLLSRPDLSATARQSLEAIRRAGERAATLTRQLLAYSRRHPVRLMPAELGLLVRETARLLNEPLGERVEFRLRLPAGEVWAAVDRAQVSQVILNLALNARDAMPGGGVLTLVLEPRTLDAADIAALGPDGELLPGEYAAVAVEDTGTGIPPDVFCHLFEPFFTTKDVNAGTGMGLAMALGVVRQCGGHIGVTTRPGAGSTFTVFLPRCPPPAPAVRPRHGSGRDRFTVLVVEQEPLLRAMVSTIAADAGFLALEAAGADQAVPVEAGHTGPLDVLITDLSMTPTDGPALFRRLAERRPGLKVVYLAGSPVSLTQLPGDAPVLVKPFSAEALAAALREAVTEAN